MTRVLSILAVACYMATNLGAAPVHDHLKPQTKTPTYPKVKTSSNSIRSTQPSEAAVKNNRKPQDKPYQEAMPTW